MKINHEIRAPEVRLIDVDGTQVGVIGIQDAIAKAEEKGLDLVEIASQVSPPVCKIIDYSKYRYEKMKKIKEAKKKQHFSHIKEVRIRPRIGMHDFEIKLKHIREFIDRNDRVKVSVIFYGRENTHRDLGHKLFEKITQEISSIAVIEQGIKQEGNRIIMMISPKK